MSHDVFDYFGIISLCVCVCVDVMCVYIGGHDQAYQLFGESLDDGYGHTHITTPITSPSCMPIYIYVYMYTLCGFNVRPI